MTTWMAPGSERDGRSRRDEDCRTEADRLRALLDGSLELLALVDARGAIITASPRFARTLGWSEQDLLGANLFHLLAPRDVDPALRALTAAMSKSDERVAFSAALRDRFGREVPVDVIAHSGSPGTGLVLRATPTMGARVLTLGWPAASPAKSPSAALPVAGVLHDIRNLLTGIAGTVDALATSVRPDGVDDLATLAEAVARAFVLCGRTRDTAPERAPVGDVNEAVASWVRLLREAWATMPGGATTLDAALAPALPVVTLGPDDLQRVVGNLLVNAKEALPTRGTITVRTWSEPLIADGGSRQAHVFLEVSDDGVGMTEQVLAHAFEPFFSTKERGGRGLGLATVRDVVSAGGGRIVVRSTPGAGTTFTVMLPGAEGGVHPE